MAAVIRSPDDGGTVETATRNPFGFCWFLMAAVMNLFEGFRSGATQVPITQFVTAAAVGR